MKLKALQLAAMINAGKAMAEADRNVDNEEVALIAQEVLMHSVPKKGLNDIFDLAEQMPVPSMFSTLAEMSDEKKKYVCGFLAAVMAANGEVAEAEVSVWRLIATLAKFPEMTLEQAIDYWKEH